MKLQVINAKEQTVFLARKSDVTSHSMPDDGTLAKSKRRFKVVVGTYIEFNDGWTIQGPDGRIHKGKGTEVRFNYRHQTWSVQRPQRCEMNVLGYVFTKQNEPSWLEAERESGFTTREFQRHFSQSFVKLCFDNQPGTTVKAAG